MVRGVALAAWHPVEYAIEAALLGTFMLVACAVVVAVHHPDSPVGARIRGGLARRVLIGVLMGLTAIGLIYSPWGQRSGAHMNPATTLTFFLLGKVRAVDAVGYILGQFIGAMAGVGLARLVLGARVMHASVRWAATVPGRFGVAGALIAELVIVFGMMSMVLYSTNRAETTPYTGLFAGGLVALYITVEAPISGMSMNPARTLGSALYAREFRGLWVYFVAPPLGMLGAAAVHVGVFGSESVHCCKMQHPVDQPCIFECRIQRIRQSE